MHTNMGLGQKIRVAYVEDDENCREVISNELEDHGLNVQSFGNSNALLGWLAAPVDAHVMLLDWDLPDISGIDLVTELSRRGVAVPVIFLTGYATSAQYEMLALERGALDFIDKTRGVDVLVKRLRLAVASSRTHRTIAPAPSVQHGRLALRPSVARAYWEDKDLELTLTEFKIISLLVVQPGRFASYREIYDCMHYVGFLAGCGEDGFRINVRSCIKRIRNKFRAIDPAFSAIGNHPAIGYCWSNDSGG